jgi:hypothetical protein
MYLWRPRAVAEKSRAPLNPGSFAALVDETDFAFVAVMKDLLRQNLIESGDHIAVVAGAQVPRATNSREWPYLLLAPAEGRIALTAMRLLPLEPIRPASR